MKATGAYTAASVSVIATHGEADFLRAEQRRLAAVHALFDVAEDVLQHHDRVIDHQADGQHQRQQGQRIHRETEHEHDGEGADQRDRDGHQRNQRRPHVAQEEEDDQHHQQDRLADGGEHRLDRAFDEDRRVVGDPRLHALRQVPGDARQLRAQRPRQVERIGGGLLDDAQRHRAAAVEAHRAAFAGGADFDAADVADLHRVGAGRGGGAHHHLLELFRLAEVGLGDHRELALDAFDAAGGDFDVLFAQRVLDVGRRQVVRRQPLAVEPDAHGELAVAEDAHVGGAGQGLQARLDDAAGDVGDFQRRMLVGGKGHPDHRVGVGLDLGDHRFVDGLRQSGAHPGDTVAHVGGGRIGIALDLETHRNLAVLGARDGRQHIDAFDAGQRILQRLGDLRLDDFGGRAAVGRVDGDHRLVDLRIFAHRQPGVGNDPDQHHREAHHGGEHRALDAEFGDPHFTGPAPACRPPCRRRPAPPHRPA
jgi:hypothetical protein